MKIYLVGGAVRDIGWGITPRDYDYCVVGASPEDLLKQGFEQVGQDFPVFLHPTTGEEYALARRERKNTNIASGFDVETQGVSIEEDLRRRDFTINSMALEVKVSKEGVCEIIDKNKIIDPYGGQHDLKTRTLRHTSHYFNEDPLRILRGCRIAAVYQLAIAPDTQALMRGMVKENALSQITQPRIFLEFKKAFAYPQTKQFLNNMCGVGLQTYIPYLRNIDSNALDFFEKLLTASAAQDSLEVGEKIFGYETHIKATLAFYESGLSEKEYVKNFIPPTYTEFITTYQKYRQVFQHYEASSASDKLAAIKTTKAQHVNYLSDILFVVAFCETQNEAQYKKNIALFSQDVEKLKNIDYEALQASANKKEIGRIMRQAQEAVLASTTAPIVSASSNSFNRLKF